jgi:hypothetical protein
MADFLKFISEVWDEILEFGAWLAHRRQIPHQVFLAPRGKDEWPAARYLGRRHVLHR